MTKSWNTDTPPDDDTTVVIRYESEDYPIMLGFHQAGNWYADDAGPLVAEWVFGWMDLEEAAEALDRAELKTA